MDLPSLIALMATIPYVGPALPYIPLACGLAAILDAIVPPPVDGSAWMPLRAFLHIMALNVGYARNSVPTSIAATSTGGERATGEVAQRTRGQGQSASAETVA